MQDPTVGEAGGTSGIQEFRISELLVERRREIEAQLRDRRREQPGHLEGSEVLDSQDRLAQLPPLLGAVSLEEEGPVSQAPGTVTIQAESWSGDPRQEEGTEPQDWPIFT
ncbi:hypothetical protein chiPu_0033967, partial [Chiloscyllium punctatum]|nr:hypothetical protein [Chiloscyllium punctatum]